MTAPPHLVGPQCGPRLAAKIRRAAADHKAAFPDGDWRSVNRRIGILRRIAMVVDRRTWMLGNEEAASLLKTLK